MIIMVPWRRRGRALVLRIGRRGASLLFLGLLDVAIAASLVPSISPEVKTSPLYVSISDVAPLWIWASLWAIVAVACFVGAFQTQDRIAFTMAAAIKVVWALLYLAAWITDGVPRSWVGSAIFTAFGGWVLVISTWQEVFNFKVVSQDPFYQRDAVIVADQDGSVLSWNDSATELLGWTREQVLGHDVSMIMPERFRGDHTAALNQVRATGHSDLVGQAIERTALRADGSEIPVEVVLSILETHVGYTFTAVIRNKAGDAE